MNKPHITIIILIVLVLGCSRSQIKRLPVKNDLAEQTLKTYLTEVNKVDGIDKKEAVVIAKSEFILRGRHKTYDLKHRPMVHEGPESWAVSFPAKYRTLKDSLNASKVFVIVHKKDGHSTFQEYHRSKDFRIFGYSANALFDHADLIVEGMVQSKVLAADRTWQEHLEQIDTSVNVSIGFKNQFQFSISKVFWGHALKGKAILIDSGTLPEGTKEILEEGQIYILFLKKHPTQDSYKIMDEERARWRIENFQGQHKVKEWFDAPNITSMDDYPDYSHFTEELKEVIQRRRQ